MEWQQIFDLRHLRKLDLQLSMSRTQTDTFQDSMFPECEPQCIPIHFVKCFGHHQSDVIICS